MQVLRVQTRRNRVSRVIFLVQYESLSQPEQQSTQQLLGLLLHLKSSYTSTHVFLSLSSRVSILDSHLQQILRLRVLFHRTHAFDYSGK